MKLFKIITAALCIGMLLNSCKKKFEYVINPDTTLAGKSMVRVYNTALGTSNNFVFVDNININGNQLFYPSLFPSTAYYAAVDAGNRNFVIKDTVPGTIQNNLSFAANLEPGKKYTIFTYDTVTSVKYTIAEDNIVVPTDTTSRIRFVNLVFSSTPVPNVDIFSKKLNTNLFTNIAVGSVSDFMAYPSSYGDTLLIRETGTVNQLVQVNNVNLTQRRNYTLAFRGRYQSTSGTLGRTLTTYTTY